jgi:hypothetical protein
MNEDGQNKSCMATATSPLVGGVARGFLRHLPFPHWLSLVAVPSL